MALGNFGKKNFLVYIAMASGVAVNFAPAAFARNIFLNGVDVSSSRSQELRNVQVRINEKGDIFISAPHYQVTEEDFFTPLSRLAAPQAAQNSATPGLAVASATDPAKEVVQEPSKDVIKDVIKEPSKEPLKAGAPTHASANPGTKAENQAPGSFASSNIGVGKSGPESMPPVLQATPPASTGTPVAPASGEGAAARAPAPKAP